MLQHAEELKKKGLPLDEIPTYRLDFYQRDFIQVYN